MLNGICWLLAHRFKHGGLWAAHGYKVTAAEKAASERRLLVGGLSAPGRGSWLWFLTCVSRKMFKAKEAEYCSQYSGS